MFEKSRYRFFPTVLGIIAFFIIVPAYADIYVYKDKSGILHFTNAPTSLKYSPYIRESFKRDSIGTQDTTYDDVIAEASLQNGVSFHLLKAVIQVESCFNPNAVSKKGALGLMQIMPENLDHLNVHDPFDPRDNIMGGATYLKAMMDRFKGQLELALAAYNAGPSAVERYDNIPPYKETQEYVRNVLKFYSYYKRNQSTS